MPYRFWLKLVAAATAVTLLLAVVQAWRADRRDRAQLAAELATTKQLLTAADARQRDRDAQLAQTLSALEAQKRVVVTPAQILAELSKNLALPAPITLQEDHASSASAAARISLSAQAGASPTPYSSPATNAGNGPTTAVSPPSQASSISANQEKLAAAQAVIPSADLKPLYDFTLNCQACQAKLSVARNDLADEKTKTAALAKERDDALRIAKGGSAWRRVTRAAKWFLLGAAAGAVAAKATH